MKLPAFSQLVEESWSKAVSYGSHHINHYKNELLDSLKSPDPEQRSAAVTSFNEANDTTVHDYIVKLIDDSDFGVRQEVLEYLEDFAKKEDIKIVFDRIRDDLELIYHKTAILQKVTVRASGTILDDDPKEIIEKEIKDWEEYLKLNSYI